MILIWNSGAVQQLHQDGVNVFNWTGSVEPPAPPDDITRWGRIQERRRRETRQQETDRARRIAEDDAEIMALLEAIMPHVAAGGREATITIDEAQNGVTIH